MVTERDRLLASIAHQHRLLERYSALAASGEQFPSLRNRLTRADYQRLAEEACRQGYELTQALEKLDD